MRDVFPAAGNKDFSVLTCYGCGHSFFHTALGSLSKKASRIASLMFGLLLCFRLDVCAQTIYSDLQRVRAAILALYDSCVAADIRGDYEEVDAINTEDETGVLPDGEPLSRQEGNDYVKNRGQIVSISPRTHYVIDSLFVNRDRATVYTYQEFVRTLILNGHPTVVVTHAAQRETWIKTPVGWRRKHVEVLAYGPRTRDGEAWPIDTVGYWFSRIIWSEGVQRARQVFDSVRMHDSTAVLFHESVLNDEGYKLLRKQRLTDALEVFRMNVESYPHRWNVYDSYGEALLDARDTVQAIVNYRKSLVLNPQNAGAAQVLSRLSKGGIH